MLRSGGASASADNRCVLPRSMSGTISTGHEAARTTDRAVLPSIRLAIHERWWSPSTIRDPSTERAIWRMTSAGVASSVIWRNELRSPFALRWAVTASRSIHASSAMAAIAAVADRSVLPPVQRRSAKHPSRLPDVGSTPFVHASFCDACVAKIRTNIEIEHDDVRVIMDRFGVHTKTEAVALALRHLAGQPMTREQALALRGAGVIGEVPANLAPRP